MLKKIDTTELEESITTLEEMQAKLPGEGKLFAQLVLEKNEILHNGLAELHKYFLDNKEYAMSERVAEIIINSINHE